MLRWYKKTSGEVVLQVNEINSERRTAEERYWVDVPTEVEAISMWAATAKSDVLKPRKAREWMIEPGDGHNEGRAFNIRCGLVYYRGRMPEQGHLIKVREVLDDGVDPQEGMR